LLAARRLILLVYLFAYVKTSSLFFLLCSRRLRFFKSFI
jgi:hypothetical protein